MGKEGGRTWEQVRSCLPVWTVTERKRATISHLQGLLQTHVSIPVIASGGAGTLEHFYDALTEGGADAALAASLFHYKELEIREV